VEKSNYLLYSAVMRLITGAYNIEIFFAAKAKLLARVLRRRFPW